MSTFFIDNPGMFIVFAGFLGSMIGSFLNVVIYRLPIMLKNNWQLQAHEFLTEQAQLAPDHQLHNTSTKDNKALTPAQQTADCKNSDAFNLVVPGSHCPACNKPIGLLQNIPIFSYLFLKGKCLNCKTRIPVRYPLIELVTALLFAYAAFHYNYGLPFLMVTVLTAGLIALSVIDYDHQILPDCLVYPLLWLGLLYSPYNPVVTPENSIIGAAAGYLILASVTYTYKLFTGKQGMGNGDFKLLAVFGAWLGWTILPLIIVLSSLMGSIIGIALILVKNRNAAQPIPFGPFLAMAGLVAIYWGQEIVNIYLRY